MIKKKKKPAGCLRIFLVLITFFISGQLGYYFFPTTEAYTPGETPHNFFPIVAFIPEKSEQKSNYYIFMKWNDLVSTSGKKYIFRLPEKQGKLPHPYSKYDSGYVTFKVLQENDKEQLVEVVFSDEDYPVTGRYTVSENKVIPRSFLLRNWGNMILFGFFGVIVLEISVRILRRRRKKTNSVDENKN